MKYVLFALTLSACSHYSRVIQLPGEVAETVEDNAPLADMRSSGAAVLVSFPF